MRAVIFLSLAVATPALAQDRTPAPYADTELPDPALEARAKAVMAEVRCVVCQGQSIADSDAPLAGDMRAVIRERIRRGESAGAVRAWLIGRYGDYITYDPPFGAVTWPLWLAPLALLAAGVAIVRLTLRRR